MAPSLLPPFLLLLASAVLASGGSPKPVTALKCPADIYVTPTEESKTIHTIVVEDKEDTTHLFVYPERGFRGVNIVEGDYHRQLAWFPLSDCLPPQGSPGSWWDFMLEVKKLRSSDGEVQFELQIKSGTCSFKCFTIFDRFPSRLHLHIVAHGPSWWKFSYPTPCLAGKIPEGLAQGYFPNHYCHEFPNTKNTTAAWSSMGVVVVIIVLLLVVVVVAALVVLLVKLWRQRRNTMEEPIYHNNVVNPTRPIILPRQRADASQGTRTEAEAEDNMYEEIEDFAPRWAVVAGPTRAGMRQNAGQNDAYLRMSGSLYDDVVNDDGYLTPRPPP